MTDISFEAQGQPNISVVALQAKLQEPIARSDDIWVADPTQLLSLPAGQCETCPEQIRRSMLAVSLESSPRTAPAAVALRATSDLLRINCTQGPERRKGCGSAVYERAQANHLVKLLLGQAISTNERLRSWEEVDQETARTLALTDENALNFRTMLRDLDALSSEAVQPMLNRLVKTKKLISTEPEEDITEEPITEALRQGSLRGIDIMRALTAETLSRAVLNQAFAPSVELMRVGDIEWRRWNRNPADLHNGFDRSEVFNDTDTTTDALKLHAPDGAEPRFKYVEFSLTTGKGQLSKLLHGLSRRPQGIALLLDYVARCMKSPDRDNFKATKDQPKEAITAADRQRVEQEQAAMRTLGIVAIITEVRAVPTRN